MACRYLSKGSGVRRTGWANGARQVIRGRGPAAPQRPSYPAQAGYPARGGLSLPSLLPRNTASPAFANDDGWNVVPSHTINGCKPPTTTSDTTLRSRDAARPSFAKHAAPEI